MKDRDQANQPARLRAVAEESVLAAGELVAGGYQRVKDIRFKGEIDLVTEYDLASEKMVLEKIRSAFPDHAVLAEEGGRKGPESEYIWYVDPLDGTTNFAHGFPVFCVSAACEGPGPEGPELLAGAVYDPLRRELFSAAKGQGARLNGEPITVSGQKKLKRCLVGTGFPYNLRERPDELLARFRRVLLAVQGVRRAGSAALDLCWVASGRFDGFWEQGLNPWDMAAGVLMIREAGGMVTGFSGRDFRLDRKEVLATNGLIHYNMIDELGRND